MSTQQRFRRVVTGLVIVGAVAGSGVAAGGAAAAPATPPAGPVAPFISLDEAKGRWRDAEAKLAPPRVDVKGIYVTSFSAANPDKYNQLLDLVDRTELNAIVVNVKDDWGNITFDTKNPIALDAGGVAPDLGDLPAFTARLRERHIYSIARIVTFKDSFVPKARPDLAVESTDGGIWRDYNGVPWLNPYNRKAWDYIVSVAKEAAMDGFNEIQFDYVRFPTDGNLDAIFYPGKDSRDKAQVIADFVAYARKELRPYGVWVSADVFGLVTSALDDMGIGQQLEAVSAGADYLSPMVYPSHYIPGNLGLPNPNAMPYETVLRSLRDARERWTAAGLTGQVEMRPWLQDFSMGYPYGPAEVRGQIQATYDAGYKQWLLWNAANVYTESALEPQAAQ